MLNVYGTYQPFERTVAMLFKKKHVVSFQKRERERERERETRFADKTTL